MKYQRNDKVKANVYWKEVIWTIHWVAQDWQYIFIYPEGWTKITEEEIIERVIEE